MVLVVDLELENLVASERMVRVKLNFAINLRYYTLVEYARDQFH
jgi:hypothetical protein